MLWELALIVFRLSGKLASRLTPTGLTLDTEPCKISHLAACGGPAFPIRDTTTMADDEDDDLYEEEFDFVDDDEDEDEGDLEDEADDSEASEDVDEEDSLDGEVDQLDRDEPDVEDTEEGAEEGAEVDEYGRPNPTANYVVHVYEYSKFKRTLDRPFTPEEAEAFCTEYNRTGKSYGRVSVAGKNDVKPKKALEQRDASALD